MESIEKVKLSWKSKFSSEIPPEFVTRLECDLDRLKNEPKDTSINLLTYARDESKSKLKELNSEIKKEEFFHEAISHVLGEMSKNRKVQVDVSSLYAKVNKPNHANHVENETATESCTHEQPTDKSVEEIVCLDDCDYEEIKVSQSPHDDGSLTKSRSRKLRSSVKDKISMFERRDSSSGEEVQNNSPPIVEGGEYATLVVKSPPLVSPKPSPASRRRPQVNEYEEISLPFLSKNESQQACASHSDKAILPDSNSDNKSSSVSTNNVSKQEKSSFQNDQSVLSERHLEKGEHLKKPPPPVPLRRKGKECLADDRNVLKETEQLTLQHSDNEPQPGTPRCTKKASGVDDYNTGESNNVIGQIHVHPRFNINVEDVEGDYCAISKFKREDKHVTSVKVTGSRNADRVITSGGEISKANNVTLIHIKASERELSRSHENLHSEDFVLKPSNLSRSHENLQQTQSGEYAHLDLTSFKPNEKSSSEENMKRLFRKKGNGAISSEKGSSGKEEEIVGKVYKGLSSSSEDDRCGDERLDTVEVNLAELGITEQELESAESQDNSEETQENNEGEQKTNDGSDEERKSPDLLPKSRSKENIVKGKRPQGVPDYEKWDLHCIVTETNISVADKDLTDTGSEDEIIYDNVPEQPDVASGHSDDSGVCEPSSTPEEIPDSGVCEPSSTPEEIPVLRRHTDDVFIDGTPTDRHEMIASTTSSDSRLSTASCVTVNIDPAFHRSDSNETVPGIPEDTESICSFDDQLDHPGDLEETLRPETVSMYGSEQLRMRHLVVKGILESEKSYLHVIEQLTKAKFFLQSSAMRPGDNPSPIALADVTTIFYKIDDFYQIHKEFVHELEAKVKAWSDRQEIAYIVKKLVFYFKIYEEYVHNYPVAVETIRRNQRNEETRHLLEDLIKHTPKDHTDYLALQKALKLSEENLRMYSLGNISPSTDPDGRHLVKNGFVVEVSRDKKATRHLRYIFLFSDILICTKHKGSARQKDVSFKYLWSLPLHSLTISVKDDRIFECKGSFEDLKFKIGNLKVELREEMLRADASRDKPFSLTQKRVLRNVEKLKKKIQEHEASLVEQLPRLPVNLETRVEGFRPRTLLFATDYEREEWREALRSQGLKAQALPEVHLSNHDCEDLINSTKLHTQVNGIGVVLLKKDEEMLTDVYCCLEMDSYGHFYKKAQTRACRYETDVSWNQDFELDLDGSQTLRILCFEKRPDAERLDEVGIYRVSGVTSDIQHCKKLFDKNPIAASAFAEDADIHTVTGVLKLYFRELPEPLFTETHYKSFIQTSQLQNADAKERCMLELLHGLPDANYYTIVYMMEHLVRIANQSVQNKMSVSNLATIFGPTLMHPAVKESNVDPMLQMALAAKESSQQTEVVYFFLKLAASGMSLRKSASVLPTST
ncbi:ABR-like protein [Mya arenaria]|uniref:ABR-like protein n=1 Tax=Mya arenaria TaxID=6604 RepID=A0ABY7E155_MYAAR|nr:ABR-like protein [Mya arenaria]